MPSENSPVVPRILMKAFLTTPPALLWWAAMSERRRLMRPKKGRDPRHVLLVSWIFPPSDSTGAHVPASFVRYAVAEGWRVSVVCAPEPDYPTAGGKELAGCIPSTVQIHRVDRFLAHEHWVRWHPARAV